MQIELTVDQLRQMVGELGSYKMFDGDYDYQQFVRFRNAVSAGQLMNSDQRREIVLALLNAIDAPTVPQIPNPTRNP